MMTFSFTEAKITSLYIHKVGNKGAEEPCFISEEAIEVTDELKEVLSQYFLSSFKSEEVYRFYHQIELGLNEVFTCASKIFEDSDGIGEQSKHLANHLYHQSTHPKIKGGEFYVVYFKNCVLDGAAVDAIGLFKSENKDTYLDVDLSMDGFTLDSKLGINIHKLDKGCLIFNSEQEEGYVLSIVDNTNRGLEAQYWKDAFLSVHIVNNEFHQTNQFLGITKQYVTKQLAEDFEVSKADQIDYLNRSVEYFKTRDTFDKKEFEEEVFGDKNVIKSFQSFDQTFRMENEVEVSDQFEISAPAVKKQARVFKSVLKLDKNFHIYIHGNREMIEQGKDQDGRKYYKIYYEQEL